MIESTLVREWKDAARNEGRIEGKIEGKIEDLLRVLKVKYKVGVEQVSEGIRACRDPETLGRWLDVALTVDTPEEFRRQTGL